MAAMLPMAVMAVTTAASMAQQQSQTRAQNAALSESRTLAERDYQMAEQERRQRLARAEASQRAGFASAGVSADGSGAAALRTLLNDREQYRDRLAQAYQSEMSGLNLAGRVNLLRQRQQWLGTAGSAMNSFSQLR